uniref:Uncharacterized protein n=1 Tax=Oryza barthii TaxID=65489 RepID=A0A0D3HIM0_9ORYZ
MKNRSEHSRRSSSPFQKLQRIQDSDWMMMMETQYYIFRGLSFGVRDNYKSRTMKKTEILGSRDKKIT